jgi:DNA-binding FadR family transcriptional regulator
MAHRQHTEILEAISACDPEQAAEAMRRHMEAAHARLESALASAHLA